MSKTTEISEKAQAAQEAALELAGAGHDLRKNSLLNAASEVSDHRNEVLEANENDVDKAKDLVEEGKLSRPLLERLKLSENKLENVIEMIESVAELEDPLGRTLYAKELDEGLELYKISSPIGVIGTIFESRPDVLPQISSLCLKSGNAVILKGGSEAKNSNEVLFGLIRDSTESSGIPEGWIQLVEAREEVRKLLEMDEYVDLLIPRGSKELIKYIQANTNIQVLGHAEGLCHIYVDEHADLSKALEICNDAKTQYPAVCNALETLLVHKDIAPDFLPKIAERYEKRDVEIRGCERTKEILGDVKKAEEEDWRTEYLDLILSIRVVKSLQEAIDHINQYGSKHTDAIITENKETALNFLESVDSSSVMVNTSTRFSDGYRYGLGAEVGISTGKIHARGPVGPEGLTSSKYYLLGNGQIVSAYLGPSAKKFTHRGLERDWSEVEKIWKEESR